MSRFSALWEDLRSGNVEKVLTQYSDVLLAGLIMSIVGMMLIPLPTPLLDVLLTANVCVATTILMVAIYIQDATKIASFPTILLITTLFRLGLNVSTTRLILLQADAGEVVRAFGAFVAGGNIVVGIVIFLILTIIQFVVITKGAERVAEVSARFTLDALPGKQMSIDADFRAGLFDIHEARRRRNSLQRESQLYGAMDGAMKFVKGDAIAGIIITIINIIGGLSIGVLQRGMEAGKAAQTYSLLTIGDGLVSQIPALLISVSAGIVVTRVASEESETHLGKDIGQQILAQPKAIAIVSVLLVLLGLVPGLPKVPFFLLALVMGGVAYGLFRTRRLAEEAEAQPETDEDDLGSEPGYSLTVPILVQVSQGLTALIDREGEGGKILAQKVPELRNSLYFELGVLFPPIQIRGRQPIEGNGFAVLLKEVPIYTGTIPEDKRLTAESAESLAIFQLGAEEAIHPVTGKPAAWIPADKEETAKAAGIRVYAPAELLVLHLAGFLRNYAHEFIGLQEVRTMLDQLTESHPSLVDEVVPKVVNLFQITEVLQRLVRERVSIRDLKGIVEALGEWGRMETDPLQLTELVRSSLSRPLCFRHARPDGKLLVYTVDPEIQQAVSESIRRTTTGNYLGLSPDIQADILEAIRRELGPRPATAPPAVVLVENDVRPYVRRLVELEFPDAAVLSMRELTPELIPQPVGMISLSGAGMFG
ncbi:MAG: type III secretion system export apparatus subunit SctV [Candidatus Eisenbacteria bacterium]